jgi:guanidinobutyrase / D-arginase
MSDNVIGPADGRRIPRFAGPPTFARLPRIDEVTAADIAVLGIPFDSGVSYRPGARFGPVHIRQSSRLLRPYNPELHKEPFARAQVVDAGDVACTPFSIVEALDQIQNAAASLPGRILALGGDHTIVLALLRDVVRRHGPVAVLHFDAHLDTWDTYFDAPYTHGTPFRRASEEGLIDRARSLHVGIRGPLYADIDLADSERLGFATVHCTELDSIDLAARMRARLGEGPIYVSVDVDVLDPAFAPGTGTPEAGGMTSRELLAALRSLDGLPIVGADIVEVAPAYDHAEITGIAAAHIGYELLSIMGVGI